MNRRSLLASFLLAVAPRPCGSLWIGAALADDKNWQHGVSLFGDLKYSAGFRHFEYVNAGAPKGGTAGEAESGTFDNSPALRALSPPALILSTRRFWYRRLMKYRADMVCLPRRSVFQLTFPQPLIAYGSRQNGMMARQSRPMT